MVQPYPRGTEWAPLPRERCPELTALGIQDTGCTIHVTAI